jgi:hypothetical protein
MYDTGVLERLVPPMAHARCLLQFNQYHSYTVDEHTLRAVEAAEELQHDDGPVGTACRAIHHKEILHLALLLHDLGKGYDEDHSEVGARYAEELADRLGLSTRDKETLRYLVHQHLTMSHLAFRRDTTDVQVVVRFAVEVGSAEVLKMLFGYLPEEIRNGDDTGTVITVPAAFNQMQKDATLAAAEMAARIRATWSLIQFTFEAHDPDVYPAVDFFQEIVMRVGLLTEGVVADPICLEQYDAEFLGALAMRAASWRVSASVNGRPVIEPDPMTRPWRSISRSAEVSPLASMVTRLLSSGIEATDWLGGGGVVPDAGTTSGLRWTATGCLVSWSMMPTPDSVVRSTSRSNVMGSVRAFVPSIVVQAERASAAPRPARTRRKDLRPKTLRLSTGKLIKSSTTKTLAAYLRRYNLSKGLRPEFDLNQVSVVSRGFGRSTS